MSVRQKRKIMEGMSSKAARLKIREIYQESQGSDFDEKYPKVYPWMECWFRLRARSETFEMVCQAFAENVTRLNKEKRRLEAIIHNQRLELVKRFDENETLRKSAGGGRLDNGK